MAGSIVQAKVTDATGAATTIALTFDSAVTAGNQIAVFCGCDSLFNAAGDVSTVADNVNAGNYTSITDNPNDTGNVQRVRCYYKLNVSAGATTVTVTLNQSLGFRLIWIVEIAGCSATEDADKGQWQTAPGTATDGLTSGTDTVSASAFAVALSVCTSGATTAPTQGTGWTSGGTGILFGGSALGRLESRTLAAGSRAATATTAVDTDHITLYVAFLEPSASITGTGSLAMSPFGSSGSGAGTFTGTGSVALSSFGESGTGSQGFTGTGSEALQPFGMSGAGEGVFTGSGSVAMQPFGESGSGAAGLVGSGSLALSPFGESGTGAETFTGMASIALQPFAESGTSGTAFPLSQSADGRYLIDANGEPICLRVITAWDLIAVSAADRATFLDAAAEGGFTGVELSAIWHDPRSEHAPFADNDGLLPFTTKLGGGAWSGALTYGNINTDAPDFTTPVTAYWNFVVALVDEAAQHGLAVLLFPSYHGHLSATDQGWMAEMVANGTTKMTTFGGYVANLLKGRNNIIWMFGGDGGTGSFPYSSGQAAVEQAMIDGMDAVASQQSRLCASEWSTPSIFTDIFDETNDLTFGSYEHLSNFYSFAGDVATEGRRAYTDDTGVSFLQEGPFEKEGPSDQNVNSAATDPIRRYFYWAWLSGIGGWTYGNGYIWRFNDTVDLPDDDDWRDHLADRGIIDNGHLATLIDSGVRWHLLVPSGLDGMRTLIPSGGGTGPTDDNYVPAACASDGSLLLAYVPPANASASSFTVDLRSMQNHIRARWYDPTAGTFSTNASAAGTFTLSNTAAAQSFTTPAANGQAEHDFLLVLDSADVTGTGSEAMQPFGLAGSGTVAYTGSGSLAMQPFGESASAVQGVSGSGSVAMQPFGESGTSSVLHIGTGSIALRSFTLSGTDGLGEAQDPLIRPEIRTRSYKHPRGN